MPLAGTSVLVGRAHPTPFVLPRWYVGHHPVPIAAIVGWARPTKWTRSLRQTGVSNEQHTPQRPCGLANPPPSARYALGCSVARHARRRWKAEAPCRHRRFGGPSPPYALRAATMVCWAPPRSHCRHRRVGMAHQMDPILIKTGRLRGAGRTPRASHPNHPHPRPRRPYGADGVLPGDVPGGWKASPRGKEKPIVGWARPTECTRSLLCREAPMSRVYPKGSGPRRPHRRRRHAAHAIRRGDVTDGDGRARPRGAANVLVGGAHPTVSGYSGRGGRMITHVKDEAIVGWARPTECTRSLLCRKAPMSTAYPKGLGPSPHPPTPRVDGALGVRLRDVPYSGGNARPRGAAHRMDPILITPGGPCEQGVSQGPRTRTTPTPVRRWNHRDSDARRALQRREGVAPWRHKRFGGQWPPYGFG